MPNQRGALAGFDTGSTAYDVGNAPPRAPLRLRRVRPEKGRAVGRGGQTDNFHVSAPQSQRSRRRWIQSLAKRMMEAMVPAAAPPVGHLSKKNGYPESC